MLGRDCGEVNGVDCVFDGSFCDVAPIRAWQGGASHSCIVRRRGFVHSEKAAFVHNERESNGGIRRSLRLTFELRHNVGQEDDRDGRRIRRARRGEYDEQIIAFIEQNGRWDWTAAMTPDAFVAEREVAVYPTPTFELDENEPEDENEAEDEQPQARLGFDTLLGRCEGCVSSTDIPTIRRK
jgi:hypothetical protein